MKQELKENQGLPASLLWTLAIIAGISVANLYYNQPLLNRISRDLQTSEFTANLIAMITQIGYAIGLLFIIPLGDLFKRKTIILINFTVLVVSLLTIALTPYIHLILFASLLTGICSVMPQIFIPIAAGFQFRQHHHTPGPKKRNGARCHDELFDLRRTAIQNGGVLVAVCGQDAGGRCHGLPHQIPLAGIKIVDRAAAFCQLPELCFRCQRGDLLSFLRGIFCPADAGIFDINSVTELRGVVNAQCTEAGQKNAACPDAKNVGAGLFGNGKT